MISNTLIRNECPGNEQFRKEFVRDQCREISKEIFSENLYAIVNCVIVNCAIVNCAIMNAIVKYAVMNYALNNTILNPKVTATTATMFAKLPMSLNVTLLLNIMLRSKKATLIFVILGKSEITVSFVNTHNSSKSKITNNKRKCYCRTMTLQIAHNQIKLISTHYSDIVTYKNLNHIINCCKFKLCGDIEKNPGSVVDPTKTICAPYSQDRVDIFGPNAGNQCLAMSLCFLIYNYSHDSITTSEDLIQIMNIGNELYGALSKLSRQRLLLLTEEVPTMVTVLDTNYEIEL